MTVNVLNIPGEIIATAAGVVVLLIFAITFSILVRRPGTLPGEAGPRTSGAAEQGHNVEGEEKGGEVVRADGYIDSFAGKIEEAGGGLPPIVKVSLIGVWIWWLIYLIVNWSQWLVSIRTYQ
jgi:hypothetical protein